MKTPPDRCYTRECDDGSFMIEHWTADLTPCEVGHAMRLLAVYYVASMDEVKEKLIQLLTSGH